MFAIATGNVYIPPGLVVTQNPDLAWELFFANVKDGYSTTLRFCGESVGRSVTWDKKTNQFAFTNY